MGHRVRQEFGLSFATISWWQGGVVESASHRHFKAQRSRRRGVAGGGLESVLAASQEQEELQTVEMQLGISNVSM